MRNNDPGRNLPPCGNRLGAAARHDSRRETPTMTSSKLLLLVSLLGAGERALAAAENPIDFRPVAGFLKLRPETKLGPCSAVDIDSRGNVYVIQRQSPPVLCFDSSGNFLRSWGNALIGREADMQGAHGLRVDRDDFVWVVD